MNEIVYGIHSVKALLERSPERFHKVFILKGREDRRFLSLVCMLEERGIEIQLMNRRFFNEKSKGAVHQGVIAYVKASYQYQENDLMDLILQFNNPLLLILDGITDPHNLGACIRSADAAGVHAVIAEKNRSACLNETVKKVACGAAENVPFIRVTNLVRTIRMLKKENIWVVGTTVKAERTLYQIQVSFRTALVMGSEGKGIRHLTREHCDELVRIPMIGGVSSINVSVAAGICLFEIIRQRG